MLGFTKCKKCGAEIARNAPVCPKCGALNPVKLTRKAPFWITVIIALIVLLLTKLGL